MTDLPTIEVAVVMGSRSDLPVMQETLSVLEEFHIKYEARILSAHRTPRVLQAFVESLLPRKFKVVIAAAGGAAHLAGVIAGHTTLPVIGVPMPSKYLHGEDSLLSIVQMPKGIPVLTTAIGEAGAANAALGAVAIIATGDPVLQSQLQQYREKQSQTVLDHDRDLQSRWET